MGTSFPICPPHPAFADKKTDLQAGEELYNIHDSPLVWMTGRSGLWYHPQSKFVSQYGYSLWQTEAIQALGSP